jgi:hypothetical protein
MIDIDGAREAYRKYLEENINNSTLSTYQRCDLQSKLEVLNNEIAAKESQRRQIQQDKEIQETIEQVGRVVAFPFVVLYKILAPILMLVVAISGLALAGGIYVGSIWFLAATGGGSLLALIIILWILL